MNVVPLPHPRFFELGSQPPRNPQFSSAVQTIVRPISREAVAAGEGTFSTCSMFPEGTN
jgi:hypothetical protein